MSLQRIRDHRVVLALLAIVLALIAIGRGGTQCAARLAALESNLRRAEADLEAAQRG